MAGADNYDRSTYDFDYGGTSVTTPAGTGTGNTITFGSSNQGSLTEFKLYFIIGDANKRTMKLDGCTVNEASIDFDVDGIATINWSGFANNLTDFTANTIHQDAAPSSGTGAVAGDIWIDTNSTAPDNMLYECTSAGANHTVPVTELSLIHI